MNNAQLLDMNKQANQLVDGAIADIQEKVQGGSGLNIMALAMNPAGALEEFGGAIGNLLDGLASMREVNSELVTRATSGGCDGE